jgi:hypothetical protein
MPPYTESLRDKKLKKVIEQDGKIELAIVALKDRKLSSVRNTALLYDVAELILLGRRRGVKSKPRKTANRRK